MDRHLVASILANCHLLLGSGATASLLFFIAERPTGADRGQMGSGRLSEGWKYWYNAIALSPLPRARIAHSKFDISIILQISFHFRITRLNVK